MKPLLYIEPEGTLLVDGEHPDPYLNATVAPYARNFLNWANKHFQVRWLTEQSPAHTFRLAEQLGIPGHEIPYTSYRDAKSSVIQPHSNFYWVDSRLTPMDISWLSEHGKAERLLGVMNPVGITENHKEWLSDKINPRNR